MSATPVLRILDASLNRAAEGLRVVEDYIRFVLDDAHLTELVKHLRHDLAAAAAAVPTCERHAARDTPHDVGAAVTTPSEARRVDAWEVCQASLERAKQSLRSLEEFSKVAVPNQAAAFEALRYRLYTIEAALGRTVHAIERLAAVRLCVLIDGRDSEFEFSTLVADLIAAGVGALQLRDKTLPVRLIVARARLLVAATRAAGTTLAIINDRPAVAAAVDADGVHLGQDDFTVKDARVVVGPRKLIGVSTHSLEQARQAVLDGANYIGVGPTFPSATKQFDAFPGLGLLAQVASEIRLPAFAIGGINAGNLADVVATGVTRVAVSSAVTATPSPAVAAKDLLSALGPCPVERRPPEGV
jgi:thiamine-phosphate pyrophosphorylase